MADEDCGAALAVSANAQRNKVRSPEAPSIGIQMRDEEVRRFPVFNREGRLGLLSLSDFAGQVDQEYTGGAANRQLTDAEVAALDRTAHMPRPIDASQSLTVRRQNLLDKLAIELREDLVHLS
jgi:hypothetical protein